MERLQNFREDETGRHTMPFYSAAVVLSSVSIKIYILPPSKSLLRGAPDGGQAEKNSLEKVVELGTGTVLRGALGGDLLEAHSWFWDQPQKMNESALSQSWRIGPPNYREHNIHVG